MTLLYLIVGSVFFILLIVGLLHLLGQSAKEPLPDGQAALQRFQEQLPDVGATGATLSRTGLSALVDLDATDRFGLLLPMGRYWTARVVEPRGIRRWAVRDRVLTLSLADFTAPAFQLTFTDLSDATHWQGRLTALSKNEE